MSFASLNIAAAALKAQQQAIRVTANNIANVNTPGYSKQTPDLGTMNPERIGGFSFGRGAQLSDIRRAVDPFLARAQAANGSALGFSTTIEQGLNAVENVFGSLSAPGLAANLDAFFQGFQQLANNPQDAAQRFNVRARAQDIINGLSDMRQQLVTAQTSADAAIDQKLAQANQLLDQIASLNTRIAASEIATASQANDLRDQRDLAVNKLARLVPIQVINGQNSEFIIQTRGGDLLAQDGTARHLARGGVGPTGFASIVVAGTNSPVQGLDQGGDIGGLLALRDQKLGGYIASVDSIAANLIFGVNQQHASGAGLTLASSVTSGQPAANPAGPVDADPNVPFAGQIVTGSFRVHVYDAAGNPTPPGGTVINITAGATTLNNVAAQLNAVAGITAAVDASGRLTVTAAAGGAVGFSDDTSNFLAAYEINGFFHGRNGADIALDPAIAADANRIAAGRIDAATSAHPPGDNTVALAILGLQDKAVSFDGTAAASLHDRATGLSSRYGTDVAAAKQDRAFRQAEAESLKSQRQAVSGVNMDEELIAMMKFQRAYQAAARVIQSTNTMLDSLMGLIR